jgi:hypothetical protein
LRFRNLSIYRRPAMWMKPIRNLVLSATVLAMLAWSAAAQAQGVWREDFEGPEPSWRDAGGDGTYKLDSHARVQTQAHSGRSSEQIRVAGSNGSFVYISHEISHARTIAELQVSVWVKADRPGLQILARAVLPRSKDPRTGRPITTLLAGSGYTQAGSWQQLRLENVPQLLERQQRALRVQYGPQVDAREAYLDRVVLNVYGGPGVTNVWIDDLEIAGLVGQPPEAAPAAGSAAAAEAAEIKRLPPTWSAQSSAAGPADAKSAGHAPATAAKSTFLRAIEYHGEALARLQALGFNAVWLAEPPSLDVLHEAGRLGLGLVAPPPRARDLQSRAADPAAKIGSDFDCIVAWDMGTGLSAHDLDATKAWAKLVHLADPRNRPLVCEPDADLRAFSRPVDVLLAHRLPLGGSLELSDYIQWLRGRPQLARPGTPLWTIVQTQPAPRLEEQAALASGKSRPDVGSSDDQIRQIVYGALAAGARGICFQSRSSLEADDGETQMRAATLELVNMELELISPWTTSGNIPAMATSNDAKLAGVVLQTPRAQLLLPLCVGPQCQFAVVPPTATALSFKVPGVPESSNAYEFSPAGLRPLAQRRVAGGILVLLGEGQRPAAVLFTQDVAVVDSLTRRLARVERRATTLQRELAARRVAAAEDIDRQLSQQGRALPTARQSLAAARVGVQQTDALITTGDFKRAFAEARRALDAVHHAERLHWEKSLSPLASPIADPLAVSFATLPDHWRFINEVAASRQSPNRLAAGDFEDLGAMQQAGWRHFKHPQNAEDARRTPITSEVDLSPQEPHAGRTCLHLQVKAADPKKAPPLIESPPLWITSAPVAVEQNQLLHVHGWVRVPAKITGSVDSLLIMDSFAAESLAERVGPTKGWKEFDLYRCAPRSGMMTVTFALTGLGDAFLDDVTIQTIDRGSAASMEQASRARLPAVPAGR